MTRAAAAVAVAGVLALGGTATRAVCQDPETARQRRQRRAMVDLIASRSVRDSATLAAMRRVPRHRFVPAEYRSEAYADRPLPIGYGQTISQPYIVAYMTEALEVEPNDRVLEIGTGSGYQAAVLAAMDLEVYTVEIFGVLAQAARERLGDLGYDHVTVRHADGHFGWPAAAPFDAVIVTAAAGYIPPALVDQLKPGGKMIIPVGSVYGVQSLILVDKNANGEVTTRQLLPVRFVPMLEGIR